MGSGTPSGNATQRRAVVHSRWMQRAHTGLNAMQRQQAFEDLLVGEVGGAAVGGVYGRGAARFSRTATGRRFGSCS